MNKAAVSRERSDEARVTVVYIAGHGRSGSTLVERLLGSVPRAVPIGELVHLWERGLRDNQRCGCGRLFLDCPFWTAVGRTAFDDDGWHHLDPRELLALQDEVDHTRLIPAMLLRAFLPTYRGAWRRYGRALTAVYAAIQETTGALVVLDSSKHVSTAYLLATLPQVDLRVVHLVRDVRGVAWSWGKRVRKPEVEGATAFMPTYRPLRVAVRWTFDNLALHLLPLLGVRSVLLRYEALIATPDSELRRVASAVGLEPDGLRALRPDGTVELTASHSVAGNPMRFAAGVLPLRLDDTWRTRLPRGPRALVTLVASPLLLAYGYLGRRAPAQRPDQAAVPFRTEAAAPSVTVVIPTRNRRELLGHALAAVRAQDYDGPVDCVVVYDQCEPDPTMATEADTARGVRTIHNTRTPGLAGARNSGVLAASGDLVAFCDDDDEWYPDKLRLQVEALRQRRDSDVVVGGVTVRYEGRDIDRVPPHDVVTLADLLRSRVMEAHPSTYLARRSALLDADGGIGLVNESLPGSYGEDYEWLLRVARRGDVAVVRRPLARVLWHPDSYFSRDWTTIAAALRHLLDAFPEFAGDRVGTARIEGQIAFAQAALGDRRSAVRSALRTLQANPAERRGLVALLVALGALRADTVLRLAHARGRGI